MKTKLLALIFLVGSSAFAASHFSFGIGIGPSYGYYVAPPPPPPVIAYAPPVPRPGYTWIAGYWYPVGPRWNWRAGYWAPRPYAGAYWVASRYYTGRYYRGYWRR